MRVLTLLIVIPLCLPWLGCATKVDEMGLAEWGASTEPLPDGWAPTIVNSIGMKLVLIPAGKFTMGSPRSEKDRDGDESGHRVEITRPFYMGAYLVTQQEYQKIMSQDPYWVKKATPSWFSAEGVGHHQVNGMDTRRFPVDSVSHHGAESFCLILSDSPEEKKAGRVYRLPTEAEWEYACRGGAQDYTVFHCGNSLSPKQANFAGQLPYAAPEGQSVGRTTEVDAYPPNAFGLHDMHGNLWQWCADWYGPYPREPIKDPQGPPTGTQRVWRGNCWLRGGWIGRSAHRGRSEPGVGDIYYGFRVVCVSQ